jgi:hypothetical protein
MAHLLYTAKDAKGQPVNGFVEADGPQAARAALLVKGYQDITFHQDSTSAEDSRALASMSPHEVTQLAQFKVQVMQKPGLMTVWKEVLRRSRTGLLADAVLFAWGIWSHNRLVVAAAVGLSIFPFALSAWKFRHSRDYSAFLRAHALGDLAAMERLAVQLRGVSQKTPNVAMDLAFRLAAVRAKSEGLQKAIALVDAWQPKNPSEAPLFECRLASLHAAVGDRQGFVDAMQRSYDASNKDPSRAMDLALAHARFGDVAQAQTLLDSIDLALLPSFGAGFVFWTQGLCQSRQGISGATQTLGQAVAAFLKLAQQPAVWTALAFCTADHCIALALDGHRGEARKELSKVWPIVKAHADPAFKEQLRSAGLASKVSGA